MVNKQLLTKIQEQTQLARVVKAANDSAKVREATKLVSNGVIPKLP